MSQETSEAQVLDDAIKADAVQIAEGRRRDGDYYYGQLVGAAYILDKIGAPVRDGRYTLTVGQRLSAYLEQRGRAQNVNENATSPQAGDHR